MLQRIQAKISQARGFRVAVDAKYAALFAQFVFEWINHAFRLSRLRVAFNRASQSSGKTRPRIRVINMPARRNHDRKQRRSRGRLLRIEIENPKVNGEAESYERTTEVLVRAGAVGSGLCSSIHRASDENRRTGDCPDADAGRRQDHL